MTREDEIRLIAYNIWEEEGCPNGVDCDHWYRAEFIWEQRQNDASGVGAVEPKPLARRTTRARTTKSVAVTKKPVRKTTSTRSKKSGPSNRKAI